MSNAARNEVLSSFAETINNSLAKMDRQKARAIPFYIHTPPMEEVNQNLPPKNQRSKVPTRAPPIRNCLNFLFPSEKRQFFSKPLGNI